MSAPDLSREADLLAFVAKASGASAAERGEHIQTLWSGYGELFRARLTGGDTRTVIVKKVSPPGAGGDHPRGWSTDRSHERKLRSYAVEMAFYANWANRCDDACRVPTTIAACETRGGWIFVLEDLDAAGFAGRHDSLGSVGLEAALRWLAAFHARFLGAVPTDLWTEGSYWHLATRPDELEATNDPQLKRAAGALDSRLKQARFQTLIHGDAKAQNLCFSADQRRVAAVDFQYVGGGCGMKDVAYFFSSCLSEKACQRRAPDLLDTYFHVLRAALPASIDADALENEWRALYPIAWADFARFLSGWAPNHWKLHGYSRQMVDHALRGIRV